MAEAYAKTGKVSEALIFIEVVTEILVLYALGEVG